MRTPSDGHLTIGVIGAGSAAEALCRRLEGSGHRLVVFERELVGGECPFYACMPSKSMLHDCRTGRGWNDAVARRDEIVSHLDDSQHAAGLRSTGAEIVRGTAKITAPGTIEADGERYEVDHIVVATGSTPIFPDIAGLDAEHERVWTSRDALTLERRPDVVAVIGGGVIGAELSFMFVGYGSHVVMLEESDRLSDDMHPRVSELIASTLTANGVELVTGVEIDRIELGDDGVVVHRHDGPAVRADRLLVSTGRRPSVDDIGLDTLGVDTADVEVDDCGHLLGAANVWLVGDVAGREQYTHAANHHAVVVADHIAADGERRFGDVALPACTFTQPPVMTIGPPWKQLEDDADVVWAEIEVDVPRSNTDELGTGFLAVAARRSTGCLVAANGIGARFDELVGALGIAIDGAVPVAVLERSVQPFPTVGEVLGAAFSELAGRL